MRSKTIGSSTAGNNTGSATADYNSIAAWEASIADTDSETGTVITKVAATDTSTVTIDATLTSARTALLTADATCAVHSADYATASAQARVVIGSGDGLYFYVVDGWTVEKLYIEAASKAVYALAGGALVVRRCFLKGGADAIRLDALGGTSTISNCPMIATTSATTVCATPGGTVANVYHCSGLANGSGSVRFGFVGGSMSTYACIQGAGACWGGDFTVAGGDYNVSEDASAPGSSATKYYRSTTGWFNVSTAGSEDMSLAAAKQGYWVSQGKDAIADYSAYDAGTDIVGTSRAAPIDPGVWQTPAAGGGTTRGMPFGTRSTAFNGGRTFAGVLR